MDKTYRDKRIPILVTEDEKRQIEAVASKEGLAASTWIRWVALREAKEADHLRAGDRVDVVWPK